MSVRKISGYAKNHSISNYLMVGECLLDARRVSFFERAINKVVKSGNIVVDAGTGTGIIAMLVAKRAAKVYAVEKDPEIAKLAKQDVEVNKLSKKIIVVNQDIRDFKLPKGLHADVVTMEMLDTGMVAEQQAQAVIAMKKNGVISDKTILLPDRMDCLLRVVDYDFNFYGFDIPIVVQARNYGAINRVVSDLSPFENYASINLKSLKSTIINEEIEIPIRKTGFINAVELKSNIYLAGRRYADTSDMNMPVIVPVDREKVKKGDKIKLRIKYNMGLGFTEFSARIV